MINPDKIEKCKNIGNIIIIKFPSHDIEQIEISVSNRTFTGFTGNIDVYNKYGYQLKNKRLNKITNYKVYVKFSIISDEYIIYSLQEV